MDQDRDPGVREDLDRFAAEEDRSDAMAAVRGHDDQVAGVRVRGFDDRLVGMHMLDAGSHAHDPGRLRRMGGGAKRLLGMFPHAKATPKDYRFRLALSGRSYNSIPDGMCPP